jgi:hypothetical protein
MRLKWAENISSDMGDGRSIQDFWQSDHVDDREGFDRITLR